MEGPNGESIELPLCIVLLGPGGSPLMTGCRAGYLGVVGGLGAGAGGVGGAGGAGGAVWKGRIEGGTSFPKLSQGTTGPGAPGGASSLLRGG